MAIDWIEFASDELQFVGGDYGAIELLGNSEEARRAIIAITEAARRGVDRVKFRLRVDVEYGAASLVQNGDGGASETANGVADDDGAADEPDGT